MQSVFLNADLIRATREALGMTQVECAKAADVSERTIRYAESGKPIRPDLAERLARVLSYSMDALLVNVQELTPSSSSTASPEEQWTRYASRLMRAYTEFAGSGCIDALLRILHPDVVLRSSATPGTPFNGTYHGHVGICEYFRIVAQYLEDYPRIETTMDRIYGKGEIVIFAGHDRLKVLKTNQRVVYWFNWIFTHREEKVVDMVQASGLLDSSESLPK